MMTSKPLDRLIFAQGGLCFFCNKTLPKSEASVEHLVPSSRSGSNSDDNCVVCCKTINSLLGSMSLKEKIRVVLNQKGSFKCPNNKIPTTAAKPEPSKSLNPNQTTPTPKADSYTIVLADLKKRGSSRPRKIETLKSTMQTALKNAKTPLTDIQLESLIRRFQAEGKITVEETKVHYSL